MAKISLIAAISKNRVLGKGNDLIYKIPDDQKRFREITTGHVIIMGRKTFESIGRPLPNRTNIIITHNQNFSAPGCIVVKSLDEALNEAKKVETDEIFIVGGGQIFAEALPFANKLFLTIVDEDAEGDVYFPDYSAFNKITFEEEKTFNGLKYKNVNLEKAP